ncbi:hypothetical protein J0910_19960 [Nocardiopsis sp. CNT-189]|uniref:hypothetical protein n=1 Tax=Nocardiopsis oceanisediminis TaxID=2816862 RepID=UPI003B39C65A
MGAASATGPRVRGGRAGERASAGAGPVLRTDRSREGGRVAVRVLLAPGVDARELLIGRVGDTVLLSRPHGDRPLHRISFGAPVDAARLTVEPRAGEIVLSAPVPGPAPVAVRPGLAPRTRLSRLRGTWRGLLGRFTAALHGGARA